MLDSFYSFVYNFTLGVQYSRSAGRTALTPYTIKYDVYPIELFRVVLKL